MNLVIKIGGHLIFREEGVDVKLLREHASILRELYDGGRWAVVVGGGGLARKYVEASRSLGVNEAASDSLAVQVTRINARLLSLALGDAAYQAIPATLDRVREYAALGKIVVLGGLQPGQSTVGVAALTAEALEAEKLIIATDVDGVYTSDPKTDPNAKLLEEVTLGKLQQILSKTSHKAGEYKLIDAIALKILSRSRIPAIYINGRNPENLRKAILGEKIGTLVKPE